MGLESDYRDIIFTFLLQTDPTNGNFCPSNRYICPFDGVCLHYVQWTPWTPISFLFTGLRFFKKTENFCPQGIYSTTSQEEEEEESKWVENRRIRKKKEEVVEFRKREIHCTQAAGYGHASCLLAQPL